MKSLVFLIVLIFLLLLAAWGGTIYYAETTHNTSAVRYAEQVEIVTRTIWDFVRPLLQLIIVLLVLQWFLEKRGIQISFSKLGLSWDARLLVALIVILTFCLVSLSGMDDRGIKEAALVVIGFYFGSAKRADDLRSAKNVSNTLTATDPPPPQNTEG
jgi:di/tricarboxylate transporter